jgi:predicted nucleic acid-binding protein
MSSRKKMLVYADTSVFGGVFDDEFARASRIFFEQVHSDKFGLVISTLLEEEIKRAPQNVRDYYRKIARFHAISPVTESAIRLQESYLRAEILEPKWAADALHVAIASARGCQIVVS